MTNKERAIKEAIEAILCAERGESHPRLNSYIPNTIKEFSRRAEARQTQPVTKQETVQGGSEPLVLDWETKTIGPGGAARND
ncbi:hypothetical protein H8U31_001281 [Salmonella enterica]|nr:hypothetical protein [Salmonella enterica]EFO7976572.1 hypothetical protein [Salmonella enterica]EGC0267531.1 hypothetical protein [Salmonella enterica]